MQPLQPKAPVGEGQDLRGLLALVWRRKWVVLIPMLSGVLAGVIIGHPKVLRPVYQARAMLLFEAPQPVTRQLEGMVPIGRERDTLERLRTLLQSNEFLLKVAEASGFREDRAILKWVAKSRRRYPDMTEDQLIDLRITQILREMIRMERNRDQGDLIIIRVTDYYPDRARLLAQKLTDAVIEANRSEQIERLRSLHDFSLEQLAVYKQRLTEAEQRLEEFQRGVVVQEAASADLDPDLAAEIPRLRAKATEELDRWREERDRLERALLSTSPNTHAALQGIEGREWRATVEEIRDLERRYAQESVRTDDENGGVGSESYALQIARQFQVLSTLSETLVAEENRQIPPEDREAAAELLVAEVRVDGVEARIDAYDSLLGRLRRDLAGAPRQETTLKRLTEEVETNRALYNAFVQQLASSQISQAFEATQAAGRLTVLEPASRPLKPVRPNRTAIVILAGVIGLFLGFGALVLVERHDQTYRDSREAERLLGLRVLGTLPQIEEARKAGKDGSVTWTGTRLADFLHDTPAYLEMRRVILQMRSEEESPVRSLLVTSTRGGEGKTTSSILLGATAAAEEPRTPVLLVDLDLRRGSLGKMLNVDPSSPGVIQALESQRIEESWFLKTGIPNLRLLSLGSAPAPRNDLLTFEGLSWFLPELTRRYGFVVIDSPPNLPVPDPLIIGQLVDAVVLVIKAGGTPRHMVERSVELQKQFTGNVRGILMNNVNELMPYYYNYRYYRYASVGGKGRRKEPSA
ncbi:MAG: hypothetical protein GF346_04760 [Candidatus Eisenbacteria bacterium]|nr:hypothetical protein [Candidatus Latescibacterota bacterium]MBD3301737.1 hypothetical protein [Candidatus Eisenbacteria bacterium]